MLGSVASGTHCTILAYKHLPFYLSSIDSGSGMVMVAAGGIFKPLNFHHSDLKKCPLANCQHFYNMARNFED